MAIAFRNYRSQDYAQLKANLQHAGLYYDDMDSETLIQRLIAKDPESIVIAEDDGRIIGSAHFADLGFAAMLWRLNVIAEYRKTGLGKLLVEEVKKRGKSRGFAQLHFVVHQEHTRLIDWYEGLGAWKGNQYRWMGFDL